MPRFIYVDGPRDQAVGFRNLLPGTIPVSEGSYHLTNRITSDGMVEYRWQQAGDVTVPSRQPKKAKGKRAKKPRTDAA